jgi:hypothetical protein
MKGNCTGLYEAGVRTELHRSSCLIFKACVKKCSTVGDTRKHNFGREIS